MLYRYAIANVAAKELAENAQLHGLEGSVTEGYGFGKWGLEKTSFIEFSTLESSMRFDRFVRALLVKYREKIAYRMTFNDHPALVSLDRQEIQILNPDEDLAVEKSGW